MPLGIVCILVWFLGSPCFGQNLSFYYPNLLQQTLDWDDQRNQFLVAAHQEIIGIDLQGIPSILLNDTLLTQVTILKLYHEFLFVCNSAHLHVYSRNSLKKEWTINLGNQTQHSCDSLIIDPSGNIYILDSIGRSILRVTTNSRVSSVWAENSLWGPEDIFTGVGWESRGGDTFLVVSRSDGAFWKILIDSEGKAGKQILISFDFPNVLGISFLENGNLVSLNGTDICSISTRDSWDSAYMIDCFSTPNLTNYYSSIALRPSSRVHVSRKNYNVYVLSSIGDKNNASSYLIALVTLDQIYLYYILGWAWTLIILGIVGLILAAGVFSKFLCDHFARAQTEVSYT